MMGATVKNEPGSTAVASRDAFGDALVRLGETHPELVVLDADLSESTRSKKFAKKFPERFFQMGIAEANMLGVAAGPVAGGQGAVLLFVRLLRHGALRPDPDVGLLLGDQRARRRQPRRRRHRRGRLLADGAGGHRADARRCRRWR